MADTQIYGTICTDIGNAAIANSVLTGTKVNFTQVAVGDANGTPYTPSSNMTELRHQVWSGAIASVEQDTEQSNRLILRAVIPSSVGGWVMREIGVLDGQGRLIAIGNTPEIPKEVVTTGAVMEMEIAIYISVVDTRGVNIVIDPTVVIASKADVNKVNNTLNTHISNTVAHMTQEQKNQLAAAVQSATIGGTAVTKSGTKLQIPMPTAVQVGAVPNTRKVNGHALSGDVTITKGDVGLSNVDNTADANKSVKYANNAGYANSAGSAPANGGTANYAYYATNTIAFAVFALRNAKISTAQASSFLGAGKINIVIK
jgi:phage-related tail fiber protein